MRMPDDRVDRLCRWVTDTLPVDGEVTVRPLTGGISNLTYEVRDVRRSWLLRSPPTQIEVAGAHDIAREYRILAALDGSRVPHARAVVLCEDATVIGAPFYLAEWVDGLRLDLGLPPELDDPTARRGIGFVLIDGMAALHAFEWRASPLAGLGRPEGFLDRQVSRWTRQYTAVTGATHPALDETGTWLRNHQPLDQEPCLIHGDYGLHNALYARDLPVRINSIVDWETATIGDPLMDVGYLLCLWLTGSGERSRWPTLGFAYPPDHFASGDELLAHYADATGRDVDAIDWYRATAQVKLAAIMSGLAVEADRRRDPQAAGQRRAAAEVHAEYALEISRGRA
jgi:aminoglycoside phosphotransferase (APT) family kinase protein